MSTFNHKSKPAYLKKEWIVAIIGGDGKMGNRFKTLFESKNHKVIISSLFTSLSPIEATKQADIVLISVPIGEITLKIIKEVAPFVKKDAVIMDLTSLKEQETNLMLKYSSSEIIGLHPLFGPNTNFYQQNIILCPIRCNNWLPVITNLFQEFQMIVSIATPEEHDHFMAFTQPLTHFHLVSFFAFINENINDLEDLKKFSSPVYRTLMDLSSRIIGQDHNLYAEMAFANPYFLKILKDYLKYLSNFIQIFEKKDKENFINLLKKLAQEKIDLPESLQRSHEIIKLSAKQFKSK